MTNQAQNTKANLDKPESNEVYRLKPFYDVNRYGVSYTAIETDKDGNVTEKPPMMLSSPIHLLGFGVDADSHYYRVIKYKDNISKDDRITVLPMADIGSTQGWQKLQSFGLTIFASKRKRDLLADYLMTEGDKMHWAISSRAGWCNNHQSYILPSGEVLSTKASNVIYNGDKSQASAYQAKGNLSDWQDNVGKYCAGNSRLSLAVGTALAAPLARLMNIEGGGFHFFGDSSIGKSTASNVALSVWGKPNELLLTWTGTGHGFANTANARNDNLLVLDEIGQARATVVADTAYSVINGIGKVQGAKDGGNRAMTRWRVFVLSTGEFSLDSYIKNRGGDWQAGQANRLPSIPADAGKGHGLFDVLHDFVDGRDFSGHLNNITNDYYGTLGLAWTKWLLENQDLAKERINKLTGEFVDSVNETLSNQAKRVLNRFALVAATLALASEQGLLPITKEDAMDAIKTCLTDWLGRVGTGNYEDKQIIDSAIDFMQLYARSDRFQNANQTGNGDRVSHNHAGYRKPSGESPQDDHFYIVPSVFKVEICKGYEAAKVCGVLADINWFKKYETNKEKRLQHKLAGFDGRYYLLIGAMPPSEYH